MDWCTLNEGTNLTVYEVYKTIMNAIHEAVDETIVINNICSKSIAIIIPGSTFVLPLLYEGANAVPEIDDQKFWAVKLSIDPDLSLLSSEWSMTLPFPKKSIDELWEAFIAPYDYYIPNSQYWLYKDEDDETSFPFKQGVDFSPIKSFGIFGAMPTIVTRFAILYEILKILKVVGLFGLVNAIINKLLVKMKDRKLLGSINTIKAQLEDIHSDVGEINLETDDLSVVKQKLDDLKTIIGVRLALR